MVHANFPITIPIDFRLAYWNCAVCRPEEHDIELRTTPPPGHRMYGEISNHEVRMNVILIGVGNDEITKCHNSFSNSGKVHSVNPVKSNLMKVISHRKYSKSNIHFRTFPRIISELDFTSNLVIVLEIHTNFYHPISKSEKTSLPIQFARPVRRAAPKSRRHMSGTGGPKLEELLPNRHFGYWNRIS